MLNKFFFKINITTCNDKLIFALSFVLFLPILFDFVITYTNGNSSVFTYFTYSVSLIVFLVSFRKVIRTKNVLYIFIFYLILLLNYLLFPKSRDYILNNQSILIALYFIPLSFLFFKQIQDWSNFYRVMNFFSIPALLFGLYILLATDISVAMAREESFFTYQEFSYALLPFVCAIYANFHKTRNLIYLGLFFAGIIEMFIYGARAPILSCFLFPILLELSNKRNMRQIVFMGLIILVITIYFKDIIEYLTSIGLFSNSYFLLHLVNGELFEHSTRTDIYINCERRINSMGLEFSGLYGDRQFCGSIYPHNILYEVLMQFGWLLGPITLLGLFVLIIKSLRDKINRKYVLFFICTLLLKYFVSDSYLESGRFWIFLAVILSLNKSNKRSFLS